MTNKTAETAAAEIVSQMNDDQRAAFDRDVWIEGVSMMLQGEWEDIDTEDVLDAISEILLTE